MAYEHEANGPGDPRLIMVGVDGSTSSWRAAAYASGLARRHEARLAIVYVQPVSALAVQAGLGWAMSNATAGIADELAVQVRDVIADRFAGASPAWEFHTLVGGAASGLALTADKLRADVVVVGAATRIINLRPLAPRLVRRARWPVIVVP